MAGFRVVLDTCVLVPDEFLLDVLDLNPHAMIGCLIEIADKRTNPPVAVDDILDALERADATKFAREVRSLLDGS